MKEIYIKPNLFTMQQNVNIIEDGKVINTFPTTLEKLPEAIFALDDVSDVTFVGGNAPFLKHIISNLQKEEFKKYSFNKINFKIGE